MRVIAILTNRQHKPPAGRPSFRSGKIALFSCRPASDKLAEKHPRGVHHEMRTHVFTASLSSLSRSAVDRPSERSIALAAFAVAASSSHSS